MNLLLTKSEQGIVVFHIMKNLPYGIRIIISLVLIGTGFYLQYESLKLFPGIIAVLAGNLLLLVKGYDNRVKLGTYQKESEWVVTDSKQLETVVHLNNRIRKWDISAMDITSGLGVFIFMLIIISLIVILAIKPFNTQQPLLILIVNAAVLMLPHWFTGVKRSTTAPALVNKIKLFQNLMNKSADLLKDRQVSFLMLLQGKDIKMPADVKMKVKFKNQTEDFLGFYGQVSMNNVQGQDYPYFYVVLVARESSKMISKITSNLQMPFNIISEFSRQDDVEILVIRQYTTKKSGYYTEPGTMELILATGLKTAERVMG